jgi:two-component system, NtrC family, sensor histidine kinase HydH
VRTASLELIYVLPIAIAAVLFGWRGGLIAALIATFLDSLNGGWQVVSACVYLALGLIAGIYTDRLRQETRKHQQTAGQLSDVYEKLQTNFEGMKRAERLSALGHLSAGLAHEIRNPLASIAGAASILRRTEPSDAKAAKCLDIIESESKRLNGLLTTFLNFAGPSPPKLQSVQVDSILDGVLALAQHALGHKNIEFRLQVAADLPPLECDPEQMTQVLLNLVINATEASESGEAVTLAADHSSEGLRIRVIDHGCGVPPEDIDKLFNPFFTTKETGTGLGLPVAHQIVSQMGGALTAHRNPAGGMTFSIDFARRQGLKEI